MLVQSSSKDFMYGFHAGSMADLRRTVPKCESSQHMKMRDVEAVDICGPVIVNGGRQKCRSLALFKSSVVCFPTISDRF